MRVCVSVCLYVGHKDMLYKMAELIEMPFRGWLVRIEGTMLDGVQFPHGKGHFWGGHVPAVVTYLLVNALRIVRLLPRANVRAQRMRRTSAFAAARVDEEAMRPLAKLLLILVFF